MTTTYITHKLSNGLTSALLPTKSKVVYCGFAIRAGSRDDPSHLPGLAHFVEHTIFKGTTRRRAWHILNRMELVGGELNAYTTKDNTFVYTAAPRRELTRSMELLNDLIRHATFPAHELEKERVVIADEINLYKDTPSEMIYDDFEELIFEGNPMAHPILGNIESLALITPEDCLRYVSQAFTPDNMLFFCMGQVTEKRFIELTEKLLSEPFTHKEKGLPKRTAPRFKHFEEVIKTSTYQAHTLLGGEAPDLGSPHRTETALLLNLLAGPGMNSRLNLRLREQKGWVYGVDSSVSTLSDVGWWQIYFGSDPAHATRALQVTMEELWKVKENSLTDTALRALIKQVKGQTAMATENSEAFFLNFGRQLLLKGDYKDIKALYERLDTVTLESLREVAHQIFREENISSLVYLGRDN